MKNVVRKTAAAEPDATEIADGYEQPEAGRGPRFPDAPNEAAAYIIRNPEIPAIQFRRARRARAHTFEACSVFYILRREGIVILTASTGRRNPRWIKQRRRQLG